MKKSNHSSAFLFLLLSLSLIWGCPFLVLAQNQQVRPIEIDAKDVKGRLNVSFNECIGAGRANEGLRADWQRQLRLVKEAGGFRYIRFHGLLSDDMGVYQEDKSGQPVYNWQYIDELFDFLHDTGIRPFVELGFMPKALASGNKTVFWWKGNITPPKDYNRWNDLIRNLVLHWTERYGQAEVSKWYFEVWNEPNLKDLFFSGSQAEYFKLYKETATVIKSINSKFRVGGPATAGNAWITEFIDFCKQENVPVDFISTHDYGVKRGFLDLSGDVGTILSQDKDQIAKDMQRTRNKILQSSKPKLELHYTEWSSSYTPADPIHDSYHEASYIINAVKKGSTAVNSMSYWTFTDIFEELGPRSTPFHGGFGLLNYQDIKKPAFYAYEYLNKLGKTELRSPDSSTIACKDSLGNLQILFWNFTIDHPGDSVNNQVFYKRNLPAKNALPALLKVKHLMAGSYQMSVFKTGYGVNDPYTGYFKMGSPSQLSRQQVNQLKTDNTGLPVSSSRVVVTENGELEKRFDMKQNDVYLILLKKI